MAAETMGEAEFKALAIYNILQFVQWPESALPAETFRLCQISGTAPNAELLRFSGKPLHRRKLDIRRIDGTAGEASLCDALWVDNDQLSAMGRMAVLARKQPLLLIGEGAEAVDRGAMVGLVLERGRARLRVDNTAARESGLVIGARLLQLANGNKTAP